MNQQIIFNHKQNMFINWCMDHLPFVKFIEFESGMLQDPFTKQWIAGVFYYNSPRVINFFIECILHLMHDSDAKRNEEKCIRYGLITEIE
jgi:hypothetical protein